MPSRLLQLIVLAGLTAMVLAVIVLAIIISNSDLLALPIASERNEVRVSRATPMPTFTLTATPLHPDPNPDSLSIPNLYPASHGYASAVGYAYTRPYGYTFTITGGGFCRFLCPA
jgi:hypothetical protein